MNQYKPYQLAKKMGVKVQSIYRWIREGKFPSGSIKKVKVIREITVISVPDDFIDNYLMKKKKINKDEPNEGYVMPYPEKETDNIY